MPHRHLDRRLKLSILRAIDAIDTHRSLLKASSALGITQPALTKGVLELEAQLQFASSTATPGALVRPRRGWRLCSRLVGFSRNCDGSTKSSTSYPRRTGEFFPWALCPSLPRACSPAS